LWRQSEDEDREVTEAAIRSVEWAQSGTTWAMKASEQARREEKAWKEDSGCQDWLSELKGAGDVGASLKEPDTWEGDCEFCRIQKIDSFDCNIFEFFRQASRVCWGWCEESTNKR